MIRATQIIENSTLEQELPELYNLIKKKDINLIVKYLQQFWTNKTDINILLNYLKFTKFIKSLYNSFALVREVSFEAPQTSSFEVESCLIFMK
jgi:hypothetical protein